MFISQSAKQLTTLNKKLIDQIGMAKTENIHFKSKDGTEIEAFLKKPIGYNPSMKYPMILRNHGGPVSQYDFGFDFKAQL